MYINIFLSNNINGDEMKIEDIMTKNIITSNIKCSIYEVSLLMKNYNIGFIPITEQNKVIGVITDRDIVIKAISNSSNTNTNIENYITKKIIYLEQNHDIEDCLKLMSKHKVKRIIITNKGKMIGIISISDIINHYSNTISNYSYNKFY